MNSEEVRRAVVVVLSFFQACAVEVFSTGGLQPDADAQTAGTWAGRVLRLALLYPQRFARAFPVDTGAVDVDSEE